MKTPIKKPMILKLGYSHYLLEAKAAMAVFAAMQDAVYVRDRTFDGEILILDDQPDIELTKVNPGTRYVSEADHDRRQQREHSVPEPLGLPNTFHLENS